jgi:8-oxo-dGTP pyrophosphatase MutT (NUDIX family)
VEVRGDTRFAVGAYAVVTNAAGEVLLTRRRDGHEWVLPGGSVKEREAPWEAVIRETREETSLQIELTKLVGVYVKRAERDIVFVFAATPRLGLPRPSEERDRVEFFRHGKLPPETSERDLERIEDAVAGAERPVLSVQPSAGGSPRAGTR